MYFQGGFTLQGLQTNITVGIMFINAWLRGKYIPDVHQATSSPGPSLRRHFENRRGEGPWDEVGAPGVPKQRNAYFY